MTYDPKVSGPWSDRDEYPQDPDGFIAAGGHIHERAVPLGIAAGQETWRGTGLLGWWTPWWPATPFGKAMLLSIGLVCCGAGTALLIGWLSGGRMNF